MKARLLFEDRDLVLDTRAPANREELLHDLQLWGVLDAMAQGDRHVRETSAAILLDGLRDMDQIRYRQRVLSDCLEHPDTVRGLYAIAAETVGGERHVFHSVFNRHPGAVLQQSVETLRLFAGAFRRLRRVADEDGSGFRSPGFTRFFAMLRDDLDDAYLAQIDAHLKRLDFQREVSLGAGLGPGNRLAGETLLRPPDCRVPVRGLFRRSAQDGYTFEVDPRDAAGLQALSRLRDRGIALVADALADSTEHVLAFFNALRSELAFYVGCLNLAATVTGRGAPTCFPELVASPGALAFDDLRDLPLLTGGRGEVVGNRVEADGRPLLVVTGANQGGKSTFLRSLGVAQLLAQAGAFVPASRFRASLADGVFTHYPREEDRSMERGRFDEQLHRMSRIVAAVAPGSLVLCNESFAATNEREGSEIAWQVLRALVDGGVRVVLVTHLHELATRLEETLGDRARFLRAGREVGGGRSFRLEEGPPLATGYAEDLYRKVFGSDLTR